MLAHFLPSEEKKNGSLIEGKGLRLFLGVGELKQL